MPSKQKTQQMPEALFKALKDDRRVERALQIDRAAVDIETRTVKLAFATETPYERYWGVEILDCTQTSIRTKRILSGGNLICDHDWKDVVGVVESVEIGADRVARAVCRFGKSARAEEVFQDVADGIRVNVSFGYLIHKAVLVETVDGVDTYRITDFEPLEISLVSVPADINAGVGRSLETIEAAPPIEPQPITEKEIKMPQEIGTQESAPAAAPAAIISSAPVRNHAEEIAKMAKSIPNGADLAMKSIQAGHTVEQFQDAAIKALASAPVPTADIGMSKSEVKRYSMLRAMNALANPMDAKAQRDAAFERECSDAVAAIMKKQSQGIFVPYDVQAKRDLTTGTTGGATGGNLVATDLLSGSFIDMLRNAMVLSRLGVRTLSGLVGNIAIPKQTGGANTYWVAESNAPTESQAAFGQVAMSPKTVGAYTDISRKLLLQSSLDVEALVQNDLATSVALALQQAAINGSGQSNQPSGLLTLVSPTVAGGTDGAAPTWANIVELETDVAVGNADIGTLAYLTNTKVRGKLKTTSKVSGQNGFVWESGDMPLNGYMAGVTNAVPSNLTKGSGTNLSAIVFGNFADLLIGLWGTLDLMVDPYSNSTSGTVRIVALQDADVGLRHAESFATMVDAITA